MAANNQPSAEGQHGHRDAQGQQIGGVVHLEANGLLERCDNQAYNNHVREVVLLGLEAIHREDVGVLFYATFKT